MMHEVLYVCVCVCERERAREREEERLQGTEEGEVCNYLSSRQVRVCVYMCFVCASKCNSEREI